jgi:signal transduction histidine kinase
VEEASDLQLLRARLVRFALEERRLIERALHDGVQQDLIGLSVRLQLVHNLVTTAPGEALASLDEVQQEVRDALARVRALAGDIYPAILDARGLPDALRQLSRAAEAAASVDVAGVGRYPAEVEAAVAFLWRAVLDGHRADEDARIRVREEDETLQVSIDAGREIDLGPVGDLVESAGGTVTTRAGPGGFAIEAVFPLP